MTVRTDNLTSPPVTDDPRDREFRDARVAEYAAVLKAVLALPVVALT